MNRRMKQGMNECIRERKKEGRKVGKKEERNVIKCVSVA